MGSAGPFRGPACLGSRPLLHLQSQWPGISGLFPTCSAPPATTMDLNLLAVLDCFMCQPAWAPGPTAGQPLLCVHAVFLRAIGPGSVATRAGRGCQALSREHLLVFTGFPAMTVSTRGRNRPVDCPHSLQVKNRLSRNWSWV